MKRFYITTFIVVALFATVKFKVSADTLIPLTINEFLPDPDGADAGKEWVELYNNSSTDVNLTGYQISTRALSGTTVRSTTLPASIIKANSFLIIVEDPSIYSGTNKVSVGSGKLNMYNSDSEIILKDTKNNILDTLQYLNVQSAVSFERKGPADNTDCKTLLKNPSSNSIGLHNYNYDPKCWNIVLPKIMSIEFSLDNQTWNSTLQIKGPVNIHFRTNFDTQISPIKIEYFLADGTQIKDGDTIFNYSKTIKAKAYFDYGSVEGESNVLNIAPMVQVNEISINNENWIELKNTNTYAIDITKIKFKLNNQILTLTDSIDLSNSSWKNCKAVTTLALNQLCLIGIPNGYIQSSNMKIEEYFDTVKIDEQNYLAENGKSCGFFEFNFNCNLFPTPFAENILWSEVPQIIITELYPAPNTGETEWLEIFNSGNADANLKNFFFTDGTNTSNTIKIPEVTIHSKEYFVFDSSAIAISLNNSGDTVTIFDNLNRMLNQVKYNSASNGKAYGKRLTNGAYQDQLEEESVITKGGENIFPEIKISDLSIISDLQVGKEIYIKGTVNSSIDTVWDNYFFIQDDFSGLKVQLSSSIDLKLNEGDSVELKGELRKESKGYKLYVEKLENIKVTSSNNLINSKDLFDKDNQINRIINFSGIVTKKLSSGFELDSGLKVYLPNNLDSNYDVNLKDSINGNGLLIYYYGSFRVVPLHNSLNIIPTEISKESSNSKISTASVKGVNKNLDLNSYNIYNLASNAAVYNIRLLLLFLLPIILIWILITYEIRCRFRN